MSSPGNDEKAGDEAQPSSSQSAEGICPRCGGAGEFAGSPCPDCDGTGTVTVNVGDA